ncbi:Uncharacterised protein [uncultured archaeon]|nr:Uncharacterised protein [uncultured archaeon]
MEVERMEVERKIEAREVLLSRIFSDEFLFEVPEYQRPLSWTSENFQKLIEDIYDAQTSGEEQYFIGSIILQGKGKNLFEIIDGQQRIVSLSVLLAVIRDNTSDEKQKAQIQKYIYLEEDTLKEIPEAMKVTPWDELKDDFRKYVYSIGGTALFLKDFENKRIKFIDEETPRYHLYEAISTFKTKLEEITDRESFVKYLLNRVYIVYIKTTDLISAFRLFSVLNARGLPLTTSDLLKNESLGEISDSNERRKYAKIWVDIEESIGREELEDVMGFLRTIILQEKAKVSIYEEYQTIFKKKLLPQGPAFIKLVKEIADIYKEKIIEGEINTTDSVTKNRYKIIVNLMGQYIPFADWIPPLIHFCHKYKREDLLLDFLLTLEKKVIVELSSGFTFSERTTSFNRIIKLIDITDDPSEVIQKMLYYREDDSRGKKARFIDYRNQLEVKKILTDVLDHPQLYSIYGGRLARYFLLRIDVEKSELANISKEYTGLITVEHILPRNPPKDSEWQRLFSEEQRLEWTNKLGNLVLLSGMRNSSAQNFEFKKKKDTYFYKKKKSTEFLITKELEGLDRWDMQKLTERHQNLKEIVLNMLQPK